MVEMRTPGGFTAPRETLAGAARQVESLTGELRITRTERDLLQEKVKQLTRRLFGASSEVPADPGSAPQKDLFFNEAEAVAANSEPTERRACRRRQDDDGGRPCAQGRARLQVAGPGVAARDCAPRTA